MTVIEGLFDNRYASDQLQYIDGSFDSTFMPRVRKQIRFSILHSDGDG